MSKFTAVAAAMSLLACAAAQNAGEGGESEDAVADITVTNVDLRRLIGDDWSGALTYLNYSAPYEYFTIPAALEVKEAGEGINLSFIYPEEPDQNFSYDLAVSVDQKRIGDESVVYREETAEGELIIKTRFDCEDLGKAAECRMTYAISPQAFSITKMVTYTGESEAFLRNEYKFTR